MSVPIADADRDLPRDRASGLLEGGQFSNEPGQATKRCWCRPAGRPFSAHDRFSSALVSTATLAKPGRGGANQRSSASQSAFTLSSGWGRAVAWDHFSLYHGGRRLIAPARTVPFPVPCAGRFPHDRLTRFDVLGIGNAIVDVISARRTDFLVPGRKLVKGSMRLIDAEEANASTSMGPTKEISGGSAGNTIAALAELGEAGGLFRQVSGRSSRQGLRPRHPRAVGVHFETVPPMRIAPDHAPTAESMILVTPGEAPANTFLGAQSDAGR